MLQILEFIFRDFSTWLGTLILITAPITSATSFLKTVIDYKNSK